MTNYSNDIIKNKYFNWYTNICSKAKFRGLIKNKISEYKGYFKGQTRKSNNDPVILHATPGYDVNMINLFTSKAPEIMDRLMIDLGLIPAQAAGILGNIGVETGGFQFLQEIGVKPGLGGYGWCQWTGTRRRLYMAYCAAKKLDPASDEANYSYLVNDLKTTYMYCLTALRKCQTANEAAQVFEAKYEYAGVPNMTNRIDMANKAWVAWHNAQNIKLKL